MSCSFNLSDISPSPEARWGHIGVSNGEELFVCGGGNITYEHIWVYNSKSNRWNKRTTTGDRPFANIQSRANIINNSMYTFGGIGGGKGSTNDVHQLNLVNLAWKKVDTTGVKPLKRCEHVQWCTENSIIVHGGEDGGRRLNDTFHLNINTLKWTQLATTGTPPTPRYGSAHCQSADRGYLFGRWDGKNRLNDLFMFEFSSNEWTKFKPTGPIPCARSYATLNMVRGELFLCGGFVHDYGALSDVWFFDVHKKVWREIENNYFNARRLHTSCVIGNQLYVFGGGNVKRKTIDSFGHFSFV